MIGLLAGGDIARGFWMSFSPFISCCWPAVDGWSAGCLTASPAAPCKRQPGGQRHRICHWKMGEPSAGQMEASPIVYGPMPHHPADFHRSLFIQDWGETSSAKIFSLLESYSSWLISPSSSKFLSVLSRWTGSPAASAGRDGLWERSSSLPVSS